MTTLLMPSVPTSTLVAPKSLKRTPLNGSLLLPKTMPLFSLGSVASVYWPFWSGNQVMLPQPFGPLAEMYRTSRS
ncbi:hypothetical protein D3C79_798960 [compost metagenome]